MSGMASVIEKIITQPTKDDQNTACTIPFGTEAAALTVSSDVCADASYPVIV